MTQPSLLDLASRADVSAGQVAELVAALAGQGWRFRRDLQRELGWSERKVRDVAEHSDGQIIGSDRGYKLTADATPEDMNAYVGRQRAQITRTQERLMRTEKVWHARQRREAA